MCYVYSNNNDNSSSSNDYNHSNNSVAASRQASDETSSLTRSLLPLFVPKVHGPHANPRHDEIGVAQLDVVHSRLEAGNVPSLDHRVVRR
jgi:hypothetical protein